jgi:hypothetical protein
VRFLYCLYLPFSCSSFLHILPIVCRWDLPLGATLCCGGGTQETDLTSDLWRVMSALAHFPTRHDVSTSDVRVLKSGLPVGSSTAASVRTVLKVSVRTSQGTEPELVNSCDRTVSLQFISMRLAVLKLLHPR